MNFELHNLCLAPSIDGTVQIWSRLTQESKKCSIVNTGLRQLQMKADKNRSLEGERSTRICEL